MKPVSGKGVKTQSSSCASPEMCAEIDHLVRVHYGLEQNQGCTADSRSGRCTYHGNRILKLKIIVKNCKKEPFVWKNTEGFSVKIM